MIANLKMHLTQGIVEDAVRVEKVNKVPKLPPALAKARADCLEV